MDAKVPFNQDEINKINEIMRLPHDKQQEAWQELSKTLSQEQIEFLMKQQSTQGGGGCLFCKIASGEIPGKKVYEDNFFIGILDIKPANKGHIVLFPKKHYKTLNEMEDGSVGGMFMIVNKICKKMVDVLKCEGTNVYVANGVIAGQGIDHVLVHIIPRFKDDGLAFGWKGKEVDEKELDALIGQLKIDSFSEPVKHPCGDACACAEPKINLDRKEPLNVDSKEDYFFEEERVP